MVAHSNKKHLGLGHIAIFLVSVSLLLLGLGHADSQPFDLRPSEDDNLKSIKPTAIVGVYNNSTFEREYYLILVGEQAEDKDKKSLTDPKDRITLSIDSFFTGLYIPNHKFWANLNPTEPDRIVDEALAVTDVGRIMLEADLQMKKDVSKYENPCAYEIGKEYWRRMDAKSAELVEEIISKHPGEIEDPSNVLFQSVVMNWIVPDKIYAYESPYGIYVVNSSLNISQEPVYEYSNFSIECQDVSSVSDECLGLLKEAAVEYSRYAAEQEQELIHPLVVEEINNAENYSDLRDVYASLTLAQWYKSHNYFTPKSIEADNRWDPTAVWEEYVKSYTEKEFECHVNETVTVGNVRYTYINTYSVGGVDLTDIQSHILILGGFPPEIESQLRDVAFGSGAQTYINPKVVALAIPIRIRENDHTYFWALVSPVWHLHLVRYLGSTINLPWSACPIY